ncbi:20035_t:CDS:1, partial [Rhizophagus irregularis]
LRKAKIIKLLEPEGFERFRKEDNPFKGEYPILTGARPLQRC